MGESILVVEDSDPVREVLESCLVHVGYEVTGAANGRGALRAIAEQTPDLVLLDVRMPDMSGWDVLAVLRHSPRYEELPVIMLTGMSDVTSKAYGWQLGCTCYLTKPVDMNDLLLVVRKVLAAPDVLPAGAILAGATA